MSTIKVNAIQGTDGVERYLARAWVSFNGLLTTISILGQGNVTSITDLGTGSYQANFTTAMPDSNFAAAVSATGAVSSSVVASEAARGSSMYRISLRNTSGTSVDGTVDLAIFR